MILILIFELLLKSLFAEEVFNSNQTKLNSCNKRQKSLKVKKLTIQILGKQKLKWK